jgi:bifunctional NMN adenylyltransferase/nudix hydrolase
MENLHRTAIVIGRFQVPYLHTGHLHLIGAALRECDKVIILIGYKEGEDKTERDPYTFWERRGMINHFFPQIPCLPLIDFNNDKLWSENVDVMASNYHTPILYHSRDSFLSQYTGSLPTKEVEELPGFSGTQIRKTLSNANTTNPPDGLL